MKFQSHLKNAIASALVLGALVAPNPSMAKADPKAVSGWTDIMGSAASGLIGYLCTDFFVMAGVNIDAPQLALEYMVYDAMKDVTNEWPPMKDYYTRAAQNNECSSGVPTGTITDPLTFEANALESVGIEALGLKDVSSLARGRQQVIDGLTFLTQDGDDLVLETDISEAEYKQIRDVQAENYQKMSTVGVARAELGLETAYQAALDAGTGDAAGDITAAAGDESQNIRMVTEKDQNVENSYLKDLPAKVSSTAMGMRVQSLMNLELAQRINLANTLQGNLLSIEAARALKNAPRPHRQR